jgi:predicted metal-dependent RNase
MDLDFKVQVKQILRKLAEAMREHIDSANDPYALKNIREAEELIEDI